ncbi:hypothetical protein ACFX14_000150 [Malus domestica]
MSVDTDPFPTATVNMVDAHLPKDKGKGKAEAVTTQHFLNQNPWPRFTVDFRSNKPPTVLTRPAIVKPMTEYSTDEEGGSALLCRKCKANVNTEPKEKLSPTIVEQPTASTQQKVLNVGQHQGVFYRLGPKVQVEETPPVRRRIDFDASFYDEDYYVCNSSSSESSKSQKNFQTSRTSGLALVYVSLFERCIHRIVQISETSAPKNRLHGAPTGSPRSFGP